MITKLDKAVIRYLGKLAKPSPRDELQFCAYMDELDQARFEVLTVLFRRPKYARLTGRFQHGRRVWRSRSNPHRPASL